ncbi:uncharacterized protein LOC110442867 isoform X1 [Mizuhopecten yessoensis]|uniref:CARD domain-containing protein n=1 Tax=Mizuhopecten yessoensis TaxID=6573 RepID=A0A210PG73_MIZYE|nr:uncharacterized protein LOC110442867 isoform X1 [Mizuhopecten yessoensis]OWF35493.1 hypothetical protein KP79_PYT16788 [Mizuhopecten yessoensis]
MEEKEKDIIERNKELLVRNIILTPEFYDMLQSYNVLPVTMVTDIKSAKSREERNRRLLKTLKLRGCDSYRKLRHVLSLTGHAYLADHLYEEETDTKLLRSEDFFGKFPAIFNHISDDIKTKLLQYLETKLKEKMLVNAWVNSALERSEILESRKLEFEHERELRTKLEKYKRQVGKSENDLATAKEELRQNRLDMKIHLKEVEESEKRFKQELGVQSRFNAANNSSMLRLTEQFTSVNIKIHKLNGWIQDFLHDSATVETQENVTGAMLTILERNIQTLMDKTDQHAETLDRSSSERTTILNILKKPVSRTELLSETVRKHVEKENKNKLAVCHELERLNESLRDFGAGSHSNGGSSSSVPQTTDLRLIRNMIATFRVEAEHLRKKLKWKDSKIDELVEELRQKPPSLRPIEGNPRPTGDVFHRERQLPAHSSPESNGEKALPNEKAEDHISNNETASRYTAKLEKRSREGSPLKPISIVTDSTEGNDTDGNQSSLLSMEQMDTSIEDKCLTFPVVNEQLSYISTPRSLKVRTPVDQTNINMAKGKRDGDTMAIQEVTSYMEEKITEGKLPPIVPNSSYLNFEITPST